MFSIGCGTGQLRVNATNSYVLQDSNFASILTTEGGSKKLVKHITLLSIRPETNTTKYSLKKGYNSFSIVNFYCFSEIIPVCELQCLWHQAGILRSQSCSE